MRTTPTEEDRKTIRQIEAAAEGLAPISAPLVRTWLSSPSLPVRTAATDLLAEHSGRIDPPLSMDEICTAVESYYRDCLIQGIDNDYVPGRGIAGLELVSWFRSLWRDPSVPREYLARLKTMLRELILEKKVPMIDVVNCVVEHLFEVPEVQEFFAEWKSDPSLAEAFALAKEWGDDHLIDSGT
jgi:hypothetical protein